MTPQPASLTVRCPQCSVVIEGVTPETMVYCLTCRKWCREMEKAMVQTAPPIRKPRRRVRCH
ncbi:MAG: hypothetical protein U0Y68_25140 [Blastocatellia bacterium]